jgi:hypothetical protein
MYQGTPSCQLGRPQPAVIRAASGGLIRGDVLDVECGTRKDALWLIEASPSRLAGHQPALDPTRPGHAAATSETWETAATGEQGSHRMRPSTHGAGAIRSPVGRRGRI